MQKLERTLSALSSLASRPLPEGAVDGRVKLVVVALFILTVLSVPMMDPGRLVWMFCFPIVMAEVWGVGYGRVLLRSLYVLPLIVAVAFFNPIVDRTPAWEIHGVVVSAGWVTLVSVVLRGLLSFQALILLVERIGFLSLCRDLASLGVPKVLVTQLFLLYRYLGVLLQEALTMHRARESRGAGRRSYPLKMWGTFAGQLLLRSVDRARRIHKAMLARGFSGVMEYERSGRRLRWKDILWGLGWTAVFILLRFLDLSSILSALLAHTN